MTMIFSAATYGFIVMTVDSAVTNEFENSREYDTGKKFYIYDGIGCVTTWGERVGNKIGTFLRGRKVSCLISTRYRTDVTLSLSILKKNIRLTRPNSDDIGYHVAGFDRDGNAHLYHIFWGTPRPNPNQVPPRLLSK